MAATPDEDDASSEGTVCYESAEGEPEGAREADDGAAALPDAASARAAEPGSTEAAAAAAVPEPPPSAPGPDTSPAAASPPTTALTKAELAARARERRQRERGERGTAQATTTTAAAVAVAAPSGPSSARARTSRGGSPQREASAWSAWDDASGGHASSGDVQGPRPPRRTTAEAAADASAAAAGTASAGRDPRAALDRLSAARAEKAATEVQGSSGWGWSGWMSSLSSVVAKVEDVLGVPAPDQLARRTDVHGEQSGAPERPPERPLPRAEPAPARRASPAGGGGNSSSGGWDDWENGGWGGTATAAAPAEAESDESWAAWGDWGDWSGDLMSSLAKSVVDLSGRVGESELTRRSVDMLEELGKRTMEVVQANRRRHPGAAPERAQHNVGSTFERHQGTLHLDALRVLSGEAKSRADRSLAALKGAAKWDAEDVAARIAEAFDPIGSRRAGNAGRDVRSVEDMAAALGYDGRRVHIEEWTRARAALEESAQPAAAPSARALHQAFVDAMGAAASAAVLQLRKMGEALLIQTAGGELAGVPPPGKNGAVGVSCAVADLCHAMTAAMKRSCEDCDESIRQLDDPAAGALEPCDAALATASSYVTEAATLLRPIVLLYGLNPAL